MVMVKLQNRLHAGNDNFALAFNNVGRCRQLTAHNFGVCCAFDKFKLPEFTRGNKGHGSTGITCPACTANAVYITFRVLRNIKINNMGNIININAACRNVGCNQNICRAFAEFLHNTVTLGLA